MKQFVNSKGTAADWATMSVSQARNPRLQTVNTQTSGLGGTQMRAAGVAQARLVLSEATLKEAKSGGYDKSLELSSPSIFNHQKTDCQPVYIVGHA